MAACLLAGGASLAGEGMPAALEAELVARLASYDKNLKARAGPRVTVLIVVKENDAASERAAGPLAAAFARLDHIGGLPHDAVIVKYAGAASLVATSRERRAAVVVVSASLASEVEALGAAFDGVDVVTVGASAEMCQRGLVVGLELVSSRPKLFINLPRAARQNVAMSADVLRLMTVFR